MKSLVKIEYTNDAVKSLISLAKFIESNNTKGAGLRWLVKFEKFILEALPMHHIIPFCKNETFKSLNLRCLNFNEWLIAFSIKEDIVTIEAIMHKSRITD